VFEREREGGSTICSNKWNNDNFFLVMKNLFENRQMENSKGAKQKLVDVFLFADREKKV
jgi:DNA primase large subunit